MKKNSAISIDQLYRTRMRLLDFKGEWKDAIGIPEPSGVWIIWGNSGNGKTRFALQLAKYLASLGMRVAYNSLEEGVSLSLRNAIQGVGMQEVKRRFILLDKESIPDLIERLEKKKSPQVILIDSIQYTGLTYAQYRQLKDRFRSKLFILISHADGKMPSGRVARSIRFDSDVKVWVEAYKAFAKSRYGGGEPYVIWEEGAALYLSPKSFSHEGHN